MNLVTQFPAPHDYGRDLRLLAMFEGAAIGIGICQLDGRVLEANPALGRMLGYSEEELTGAFAGELYPELGRQFGSGGRAAPDGSSEDRSSEVRSFADDSSAERLLAELIRAERDWFEIDRRYRRKDGSEFWAHLTISLGRDERRQAAFLIVLLSDATASRRMQQRLREAEKVEVIGRLAGGIAHDFNNLLTGILLYCDLLSARLEGGASELCQHVNEMRIAGEQGAALTQQLLAIARKQAAEPRPVAINEIVLSTQNLLQRLIGERIELTVVLDPALEPVLHPGSGLVLADPAQLRQILLNLVLNARDAMPRGGKIRLITRAAELPDTVLLREAVPARTRRSVSLTVKDNGCGMDAETRERLFEPFFTTKIPGQGTGLGLSMVQRIVSAAGGRIEIESEAGRGTSIEVFLPVVDPVSDPARSP